MEEKRVINYESADLRSSSGSMKYGDAFYVENGRVSTDDKNENDRKLVDHRRFRCLIHSTNHKTAECREYIAMKPVERVKLLREKRGCWTCLMNGHRSIDCYHRVKCKENGCEKFHHTSLHEAHAKGVAFHASSDVHNSVLLQLMRVPTSSFPSQDLNAMWDSGANIGLITFERASELELQGESIRLSVTPGGEERVM